jgi:hypothetical protein
MYDQIRFQGYYIHETKGFDSAMALVKQEMREREPDDLSPKGYGPNEGFKKQVESFRSEFHELRDDLLGRARAGGKVDREELTTLQRAEQLYAVASASGPETAFARLADLKSGKEAFNGAGGMSSSRLIAKLSGLDGESGPKDRFTVSTRLTM